MVFLCELLAGHHVRRDIWVDRGGDRGVDMVWVCIVLRECACIVMRRCVYCFEMSVDHLHG